MPSFEEVADRVWVARYSGYDVNVSVVEGGTGLVVVDTTPSDALVETLADLRRLSARPVVAIVNTHAHFDHVSEGNPSLRCRRPTTGRRSAPTRARPT